MAEVTLTINGRNYGISCEDGQEQRVIDLGQYVDNRIGEIARAGAASNESHLLVLAGLVLADEIFELREGGAVTAPAANGYSAEDEKAIAESIDYLAERINAIAGRIQKA